MTHRKVLSLQSRDQSSSPPTLQRLGPGESLLRAVAMRLMRRSRSRLFSDS